jgi:aryl-alcohol dehydrogenase-like predicted oxidoreductase
VDKERGLMAMEKRRLGRSDLHVAPLCLGGNVFGWTADEATSQKLLDAFIAAGFNFIDTADVYSKWATGRHGGESEIVIGDWLRRRGKRDDVVIATKVGSEMAPDRKGLSKPYILRAVEDSLRRLGTDYIDLYQSHRDDPDTPVEETLEAYGALIKAGKVRAIGASNFTAERLAASLEASEKLGLPRYESPAGIQPDGPRVRAGAGAALRPARNRRHSLLRVGVRLPHRQVPQQGRP